MIIDKRLLRLASESKKYIAGNVILQWMPLVTNIGLMTAIVLLLSGMFRKTAGQGQINNTVSSAANSWCHLPYRLSTC